MQFSPEIQQTIVSEVFFFHTYININANKTQMQYKFR